MFTNKEVAIAKLLNLSSALAGCGITTVIEYDDEHGIVGLSADLWNCIDGSTVNFSVWAEDTDDFAELEHCVEPEGAAEKLFEDFSKEEE